MEWPLGNSRKRCKSIFKLQHSNIYLKAIGGKAVWRMPVSSPLVEWLMAGKVDLICAAFARNMYTTFAFDNTYHN